VIDLSAIAVAKALTLLLLKARTEQLTRRSAARVAYLMRVGVRPGVIIQSSELHPAQHLSWSSAGARCPPHRMSRGASSRGWLCKIGVPLEEVPRG
jgi:hypothetical protein